MASGQEIFVDTVGAGFAYVIPSRCIIGEPFDFYAVPDTGETLVSVYCEDDWGNSIAVPQSTHFTMNMPNTFWIKFTVTFSGTTPPTPTPTPTADGFYKKKMPIWMYPCLRKRR